MRALLPDGLSLSVINTADECVVSGPADVIDDLADAARGQGGDGDAC